MSVPAKTLRLRGDGLSWTSASDEVIALDLRSSTYLSTNASGKLLWQMLDSGATEQELVDSLVAGYGITTETAISDIAHYLDMLRSKDLLAGQE